MTRYATIRQTWTIAFGAEPRSRGVLSAPPVPPIGLIRRAAMRVAFARQMYFSDIVKLPAGYNR